MNILNYCCNIVLLFFTFSVLGWCMEVMLKYQQYHRFINRGFLIGPYLPIYGSGASLITMILDALLHFDNSYGMTFIVSFFSCGILEYMVSYYLEKKFHARWWDYSQKPMNLHGRVWIGNLILFGIGGTIIAKGIDPIFFSIVNRFSDSVKISCSIIIILVMGTDYTISHFVMKLMKTGVEQSEADDTETLNKEMRMLFTNKSVLHKRMIEAYPEIVYHTDKVHARLAAMKKESELLTQELRERLDESRDTFIYNHEPSTLIKNKIIDKQERLILLLEQGSTNREEMQQLREELEALKKQLTLRDDVLSRLNDKIVEFRALND